MFLSSMVAVSTRRNQPVRFCFWDRASHWQASGYRFSLKAESGVIADSDEISVSE
jgi:hypothetical protein